MATVEPRLEDLRILAVVASSGRIVAAADQLGLDPSTVSRRLRALERSLGTSLIERGEAGWALTEPGRAVVEHVQPLEGMVGDVVRAVRGRTADDLSGSVRLAAPEGFAASFAVPALARLHRAHPDVTVEILTSTRELSLQQFGFDLAVTVGLPSSPRLFSEHLCDYRLGLYAHEDYLQARGTPQGLDELEHHTVVFYVESMLQVGDLDLRHYVPADSRFATTSVFGQLAATVNGAGIGLLHRFMAADQPGLVELDLLSREARLSYSISARRQTIRRPLVQAVRQTLREEVARRAGELL